MYTSVTLVGIFKACKSPKALQVYKKNVVLYYFTYQISSETNMSRVSMSWTPAFCTDQSACRMQPRALICILSCLAGWAHPVLSLLLGKCWEDTPRECLYILLCFRPFAVLALQKTVKTTSWEIMLACCMCPSIDRLIGNQAYSYQTRGSLNFR